MPPLVTLQFNLPEEKDEYELAYNGAKLAIVLDEFDNYLRGVIKYNQTLNDEQIQIYETIRDKLWELKNE